jgi:putative heme-binding domain-containing protein
MIDECAQRRRKALGSDLLTYTLSNASIAAMFEKPVLLRRVTLGSLLALAAVLSANPAGPAAQDHVGQYAQSDILKGAQLYATQCAVCHGLAGNGVATVDLRQGRFRTAVSDDDLKRVIRAGLPASGMPPMKMEDAEVTAVIAFIRAGMDTAGSALTVKVGDPDRGRIIARGKGQCLKCHRIKDEGGRSGPDLSEVGSSRSPMSLHLSLIEPSKAMLPTNRPIRAVTREGRVITGRRLNEDTYSVQIADEEGRLLSVLKSDLREFRVFTTSPMPSYKDLLTAEEIADVFAYLLSLKDPNAVQSRGRGF